MAEKVVKKVIKKAAPKKAAVKTVKVVAPVKKAAKAVKVSMNAEIVSIKGVKKGSVTLPETIFGAKVNRPLIAQAVRVYLANQRSGNAHTKTRSEVAGSRKKVWRQKGTGRARHGNITGPIFVGGGITHGPRTRDFSLDLPRKMKKAALFSALSAQFKENKIVFVDPEGLTNKTKTFSGMLKDLSLIDKKGKAKRVLVVLDKTNAKLFRSGRNIEGMVVERVQDLSTYRVIEHKHIIFLKDAVGDIEYTKEKRKI